MSSQLPLAAFRGIDLTIRRLTALCVVLVVLCAGCADAPPKRRSALAPPLLPSQLGSTAQADTSLQACPDYSADDRRRSVTPVQDLVLIYSGSGRDFSEPTGLDGYALLVVPLDADAIPVQQAARATIALFPLSGPAPAGPDQPLLIWHVPPQLLGRHWAVGHLLDGYLFRLAWLPAPPAQGRYSLFVRLDYGDDPSPFSICATVEFEDFQARGPAPPAESPRDDNMDLKVD